MEKLNLIIDTSIIIEENFFKGTKMNRLSTIASEDKIQIYLTDVIDEEVKSNIKKKTQELKSELNKTNRILNNKFKFIKNIYSETDINDFIKPNHIENGLLNKYERFKEFSKVEIIYPQENFNIGDIMKNYFESKAPFDKENKKNEFPDAISFKIAEDYFKKIKSKAFFVTKDSDFDFLDSNYLLKKNELDFIFEEVAKNVNPEIFGERKLIYNSIIKNLNKFTPTIDDEIKLTLKVKMELLFYKYDLDILPHIIHFNRTILDYHIFDISKNQIGFKIIGKFNTEISIHLTTSDVQEPISIVFEKEKLKLNRSNNLEFKGEFEIRFYFEYEFPYQILEENITYEMDDDIITEYRNE
ncbi:hypothetical protein BTO15_00040 [Polaribacter sejongensis]|uniref:DUF4935 domain-containing protein n=1 Tax=Polaribacter sejongensis TaxID=985043 RepID=A0ABN5F1U4_9FLAO|nr:PIN domain-containing protein [Polaribacter sejongensis]AUC20600.1 hypothetical protein BTO15_00040 [Polaribacter sejongensis]